MSARRPLGFVGFLVLPLVFASAACDPSITEIVRAEVCSPVPEWQREFPGDASGPLFDTTLVDGDGYVATGSVVDNNLQGSGVVSVDGAGALLWQTNVGSRYSVLSPSSGGFALAGTVHGESGTPDIEVNALSPEGTIEWTSRFGTPDAEDYVSAIVPDEKGLFIVGDTSIYSGSDADLTVTRLDAAGNIEWSNLYGEPSMGWNNSHDERVFGASLDAQGRVVVGSQRWTNGSGGPPWIFALDAQGNIAWEYLDTVTYYRATEWVFLPMKSGGFLVAGYVYAKGSYQPGPARLIRLDAEGNLQWIVSLDDGSDNQQVVDGGFELPNGDIVLAGYSANSARSRVWKLDSSGSPLWTRDYDEEIGLFGRARAMPDGGIALLARKTDYDTHLGTYQIIRTRENGEIQWKHETIHEGLVLGGDLIVDEKGKILVGVPFKFDEVKHGRLLLLDEACKAR